MTKRSAGWIASIRDLGELGVGMLCDVGSLIFDPGGPRG